ncbi:MAG: DNA methyltransferase [Cyanobacteria bacterium P01_F01_bin.42]
MAPIPKSRAPRNKTLTISEREIEAFRHRLVRLSDSTPLDAVLDRTIEGDTLETLPHLPEQFVNLMVVDPPYNLTKSFNGTVFRRGSLTAYEEWLDRWIQGALRLLKPNASVYICGDWQSSTAIHRVCEKYFTVRNRISWEREKGRGARSNWKSCTEDIWFCTVSQDYCFNVDAVKMKRRVLAPYRDQARKPKDWQTEKNGNFRVTYPSNFWSDISIPFWSMPENTDHPTQKPEKLVAKLLLASSEPGDVVFDPFLGSGTTSVVAKKLGRRYVGIEKELKYCCIAEKRLAHTGSHPKIQGYAGGYFWERNTLAAQKKAQKS